MKKLLAAVLAASMCLSYATFVGAAGQSSRGLGGTRDGDSQFKVEFSADGGSVTATVLDSGTIVTGDMVDSGKTVTFIAKGPDANKAYTATWTGATVDANNSLKATALVNKALNVKATITAKAVDDETYAITFANPKVDGIDVGTLTATKADGTAFTSTTAAKKGEVITFTVTPTDTTKTYTAKWTGAEPVADKPLTAKLTVADKAVTVSVELTDVSVDNVVVTIDKETKGGLLDIRDESSGKYLPVGEAVTVPKGTRLLMGYVSADNADIDTITYKDAIETGEIGVGYYRTVNVDTTFTATFQPKPEETQDEMYGVTAYPNEFVSAEPLIVSGQLKMWYWDGKQTSEDEMLSGATFKLTDDSENKKFTIDPAGVFTSTEKLADGKYYMYVDATHSRKTLTHEQVEISILGGKVNVRFARYIANNAGGQRVETRRVDAGATFGSIDKPQVPQMYGDHKSIAWADGYRKPIADTLVINKATTVYTYFDKYEVTMLGLDGNPAVPEDPDEPEEPGNPGGGSSGGGGGGGGSILGGGGTTGSGSATVSTGTATKEATKAVENAVRAAVSAGSKSANAAVTFKNVKSMTPDAFKAVNAAAAKASKGVAVKTSVQMDTIVGGKVAARMYIDPTLAAGLKTSIKTTVDVSPKSKENAKTASVVSKYFSNTAAVVSFAQQGAFGMSIEAAVKVDTSKMNTKTLSFFSYDAKTNKFTAIAAPAYFVDNAGYLHFTTPVGGSIVITDKPLERK